jgi:hypothetical protein
MGEFRIEFVDDYETTAGYLWHEGCIVLGSEEERFGSLIHEWIEADYERQWLER